MMWVHIIRYLYDDANLLKIAVAQK